MRCIWLIIWLLTLLEMVAAGHRAKMGSADIQEIIRNADLSFHNLISENEQLLAGFLQLGFHDCVGGCDGCVDVTHPANTGLKNTIKVANEFRQSRLPFLSQADVNAFLSIRALERTILRARGVAKITLKYGRIDCNLENGFPFRPLPGGNSPHSILFLRATFGLTTQEAVALLGAHSVGRAREENSGFHGPWDATEFAMDSGYFQNLITSGWQLERVSNHQINSTQFVKNRIANFTMLIADMVLLKSFVVLNDGFDTPNCTYTTCSLSEHTSSIVGAYAENQTLFHEQLVLAFTKMIETSPHKLRDLDTFFLPGINTISTTQRETTPLSTALPISRVSQSPTVRSSFAARLTSSSFISPDSTITTITTTTTSPTTASSTSSLPTTISSSTSTTTATTTLPATAPASSTTLPIMTMAGMSTIFYPSPFRNGNPASRGQTGPAGGDFESYDEQ